MKQNVVRILIVLLCIVILEGLFYIIFSSCTKNKIIENEQIIIKQDSTRKQLIKKLDTIEYKENEEIEIISKYNNDSTLWEFKKLLSE